MANDRRQTDGRLRAFLVALSEWCRAEFVNEVANGFPTLLSLRNPTALRTVEVLRASSPAQRDAVMAAKLRWSHQRAVPIDDSTKKSDQLLLTEFARRIDAFRLKSLRLEASAPGGNRRATRRLLKQRLADAERRLGTRARGASGGVLSFVKRFGAYAMTTDVDMSGSLWDVSMSQTLERDGHERILEAFSWPDGLGITGADRWDAVSPSDVTPVAAAIVDVSERVLTAVEHIVAEIGSEA